MSKGNGGTKRPKMRVAEGARKGDPLEILSLCLGGLDASDLTLLRQLLSLGSSDLDSHLRSLRAEALGLIGHFQIPILDWTRVEEDVIAEPADAAAEIQVQETEALTDLFCLDRLRAVIDAYREIRSGNGQTCQFCHRSINPERLRVMPTATTCVPCASSRTRRV